MIFNYITFQFDNFRKRILHCVSDTEEFESLPAVTRYNLLKNNLRVAELLIKIFWFNSPSPIQEADLIQGADDAVQWQVQSHLVPFSMSTKNTLLDLINTVSHPILGDWSVIIMMSMLFIFGAHSYSTGDSIVQSINKQLWTMLRRHLTNTMSCQASVVDGMAHIQHCLYALPTMLTLNKDVFNKFV